MTTEIATLGLAIDSRQTVDATKALDDFAAAATPAAHAAETFETAGRDAATASTALVSAVKPAVAAIDGLNAAAGSRAVTTMATGLTTLAGAAAPAASALTKLQQQINAMTGVKMGPQAGNRADDIAAYGAELDNLRAKFNPLYAVQRDYAKQIGDINTAAKTGAINEKERAVAVASAAATYSKASKDAATSVAQLEGKTGLARHEMINFGRQMQDVGTMMAMGASPMQVVTSQAAQIVDIFASSKGTVGGFFSQMASGIASVLSPTRLLVGTIAGVGVSAALMGASWSSAQKQVQIGLMGIGRASGATAGDINAIADATSTLTGLSTSQAREVATALANTGKIGVDNIKRLTGETRNFAAVLTKGDIEAAGESMAKIFAAPGEGAKQLNAKLGILDAAALKNIETLELQGDRQGAINALIEAMSPAIAGAAEKTGLLSKSWNTLGNVFSETSTKIGKGVAGTIDEKSTAQLEARRTELEKLIETTNTSAAAQTDWRGAFVKNSVQTADVDLVKGYREELAKVNTSLADQDRQRKSGANIGSQQSTQEVTALVNAFAPGPELIRNLSANLENMMRIMNDPALDAFKEKMGSQLPQAVARFNNQVAAFKADPTLADPIQNQVKSLELQTKALNNASPAMRKYIAEQMALRDAVRAGADPGEAKRMSELAGKLAYGGTATDIQQAQQKLALYGQTANAADALKAVELNLQAANLQGITIDDTRAATLKRLAVEQNLGITAIKANTDALNTDAMAVGMSAGAAAQYTAVQNALNEAKRNGRDIAPERLEQIKQEAALLGEAAAKADLMRSAYTGLVQGPMQTFRSAISSGATAMDALKKSAASALDSISTKLMDMAAQKLWQSAFGGSSGGGLMSLLGLGGGSVGNYGQVANSSGLGAGTGGLSFPMFANGTDSAPGGVALVGEKGPELVELPRGSVVTPNHELQSKMSGGGSISVPISIQIDATGADAAGLSRVQQQLATLQAQVPSIAVAALKKARSGRNF